MGFFLLEFFCPFCNAGKFADEWIMGIFLVRVCTGTLLIEQVKELVRFNFFLIESSFFSFCI